MALPNKNNKHVSQWLGASRFVRPFACSVAWPCRNGFSCVRRSEDELDQGRYNSSHKE